MSQQAVVDCVGEGGAVDYERLRMTTSLVGNTQRRIRGGKIGVGGGERLEGTGRWVVVVNRARETLVAA